MKYLNNMQLNESAQKKKKTFHKNNTTIVTCI